MVLHGRRRLLPNKEFRSPMLSARSRCWRRRTLSVSVSTAAKLRLYVEVPDTDPAHCVLAWPPGVTLDVGRHNVAALGPQRHSTPYVSQRNLPAEGVGFAAPIKGGRH